MLYLDYEKLESLDRAAYQARQPYPWANPEGLLTPTPFDEELEFLEFDIWHYYGRTAKHGAFMGGADFVQWHGNYELLHYQVKIKKAIAELRAAKK